MASAHSELSGLVASLREAAHQGDWKRASQMIAAIAEMPQPADRAGHAEYLMNLREALVTAKASRSHVAVKLRRVRAAAGFIGTNSPGKRHDFVDSPRS